MKIRYSSQFKKDLTKLKSLGKKGKSISEELAIVLNLLMAEKALPAKYRDHCLTGNYETFKECHIKPDWLLIYRIKKQELELYLFRTGTHSDLF